LDKIQDNPVTQSTSSAVKEKNSAEGSTASSPWLLVLIFRLLLLGVGGGLAIVAGIAFATIYPDPTPERPLVIKVLNRIGEGIPLVNSSPASTLESANPPSPLTSDQKQQAQAQLDRLQGQLGELREATTTLENQLGASRPNQPIETRLQAIALQLQGGSANANATLEASSDTEQTPLFSQTLSQSDRIKVTLPSDALFEANDPLLRPEASLILDQIIAELRDHPPSTVRIAAHTDTEGEAEANRELSFRRAKAVQQYLNKALGDNPHRWLALGYGETQPLVTDESPVSQQRNRRIEIAVN
jgi:outer membrane protein OmpA-like peptidoglycan-associated protein